MAKIVVDVGVYLPSNPDGKVVDIDKNSGRPLQSHAKASFSTLRFMSCHPDEIKLSGAVHGDVQSAQGTDSH